MARWGIAQRQKIYGTAFGAAAFATGWLLFAAFLPENLGVTASRGQTVTWFYLSAHYVQISGLQVAGLSGVGQTFDLVDQFGADVFRTIPVFLIIVAGMLVSNVMGYTTRPSHLIKNAASVLLGYLSFLFLAFVQSAAQPVISALLTISVIGFVALYLGSRFIGAAVGGFPVIGFTSLGSIALIGMLIILVGMSAFVALLPAAIVTGISSLISAGLVYLSKSVPR